MVKQLLSVEGQLQQWLVISSKLVTSCEYKIMAEYGTLVVPSSLFRLGPYGLGEPTHLTMELKVRL